ncbi:hypothetical protein CBL_21286 [Carabus blaptoides fortunei]
MNFVRTGNPDIKRTVSKNTHQLSKQWRLYSLFCYLYFLSRCRVNPQQADTSNIPVIQGTTDMYVIGLHRPGQPNLQMCNLNNPAVAGLMANLRNGAPGTTPYTTVPNSQHTYGFVPPPPAYPQ